MRVNYTHFLYVCFAILAVIAPSYGASMFSKYGVIQNVQNYSTNPFWNPDSPYNQRMPQPVYATGPDITTDECQRIVTSLITVQCMNLNNCANTELSDIRPNVMLQLSRMNGNYATACGGYIDGAFDTYKSQYAGTLPRGTTAFPTAVAPNPTQTQQIQIKNPFTTQTPDWAVEVQENAQKLEDLQSQNGTNVYGVSATAFPTTYADLSFTERMENEHIGYEPYKDVSAYDKIKIESLEDYYERIKETKKEEEEEEEEEEVEVEDCEQKTCAITYNLNGGNNHQNNPNGYTTCNNPVQLQPPTKTNYIFDAWYTDEQFNSKKTEITDADCPTNNGTITLYAKWKSETTPITCDNWEPTQHTSEEDKTGKYAILAQPYTTKQTVGEQYVSDTTNTKIWWDKDCSDHNISVIDDDAPVNKWLYDNRSPGSKYDYWINLTHLSYQGKITRAMGLIVSDGGGNRIAPLMRFNDLRNASCTAEALAKYLKKYQDCTEKRMHFYVVEIQQGTNTITKIVAPDNPDGNGYKAFND